MQHILSAHDAACDAVVWLLLRLAVAVETWRRLVRRRAGRIRASLRRLLRQRRAAAPTGRAAWNRTPAFLEEKLVRLHVEQPRLGAGQLVHLAERVLGFGAARETIRRILLRRRDLVVALEEERRRRRRRIHVYGSRQLWGLDLTLVWLLGFWPVWLLGVIDYHGSRVVALRRLRWPTSAAIVGALGETFDREDVPERVLTDNGGVFTAEATKAFLVERGVKHTRIRPGHAWTNGRVERVFRTCKETVGSCIWLFGSLGQIDRFCADFVTFYNRDRPHSAWDGRTPDEVFFGRPKRIGALGRVVYFDGQLEWYRFG